MIKIISISKILTFYMICEAYEIYEQRFHHPWHETLSSNHIVITLTIKVFSIDFRGCSYRMLQPRRRYRASLHRGHLCRVSPAGILDIGFHDYQSVYISENWYRTIGCYLYRSFVSRLSKTVHHFFFFWEERVKILLLSSIIIILNAKNFKNRRINDRFLNEFSNPIYLKTF